jgi:hypothetical protein
MKPWGFLASNVKQYFCYYYIEAADNKSFCIEYEMTMTNVRKRSSNTGK